MRKNTLIMQCNGKKKGRGRIWYLILYIGTQPVVLQKDADMAVIAGRHRELVKEYNIKHLINKVQKYIREKHLGEQLNMLHELGLK